MEQNTPQEQGNEADEKIEDTKVEINLSEKQRINMELKASILGITLAELIFSDLQNHLGNNDSPENN